ncbi:polymorphic toxin MafB class 3 [Neisseria gonorrhoeae]|uniref:polymorphic toxin MafB class 3 n=1 Tax=Neisseria gonorrhoeae TaxID=485 RepID=UPI001F1E871F|nr:polymorphic toxin MafB class 3 [Neisseria gonorrhoeae]MCF3026571.1 polymorphic toxin MafB class 3 [Neisseria gonorrhoeae]MCF3046279.1 polymorphic toxin MafB class 3 [Neisseria gonorrhoeae]MCF3056507.1 polymorphic toxin MafB class 3 [Neisseria gonorrhoeae]MCF3067552.1 polymorphic toxin MafB class 3 [Neisseria gonorrhoeae]MCF3072389.1 polymorphic toxin MafB class 3 [Neisseria gonorrhoeae]
MNLPIQKFMMLFAAAISLLQIPISHANGLDARLRDDMQAKHYEPGGKYHLFGNARGSVKNRVCAVQTFDATAVGPILPITHERTGFEGIIGYETHFSGHGHEVHSPFDNHDSKSTSDFSGGVDGGFTVYQLHRTGSEIHPADGYDGPQGGGYPEPQGARDIYSYHIKGTSTKTKINTVPQAPFSDRWLKENAGAASGFLSRADEAGKLIWENDPDKNWRANRMDDIRGIIQGAANPFLTGFQGLGVGAITDSAVNPVTYAAAQQTLQGIHDLGNVSPAAQLAAASLLQDSAFAVKDGINSARQWADAHPNITATAQTALAVAETATTVWGGKKVELNPAKWDWVKNTGYKKPAARHMQTVDGEMAGKNKPPKPSTQQHSTHSDNNIGLPAPYVKPDTSISPTGTIQDRIRWTKSKFPTEKSLNGHFKAHGKEFGDITIEDYQKMASDLLSKQTSDKILGYQTEHRRVRYDINNNIYVLANPKTFKIKTMFKPNLGKEYYDGEFKKDMGN